MKKVVDGIVGSRGTSLEKSWGREGISGFSRDLKNQKEATMRRSGEENISDRGKSEQKKLKQEQIAMWLEQNE